jgi:oligo-1,6-glucosidase
MRPWWKDAVVYQVYPKSFRDASGDGVGDICGIIEKLDYLADLGIDCLWVSPIFQSPMADNGYDVSDYKSVAPQFGAIRDVDRLIEQAHQRGIRLVLDFALNHTSTAHPWFQEAQSPSSAHRDWYIWRDGRGDGPPNNWRSIFGGSAWSRIGEQYYLHLFDRTQADLNWENPKVRAAIHEAMRFWLDRGIDGYRLDVVSVISKPDGLPDAADHRHGPFYGMLADGPRLHAYLRELHQEVFAGRDCVAIGEAPGVDPSRAARLVDPSDPMLDMIYHFDLVEPVRGPDGDWDRVALKKVFSDWDRGIGPRGWNTTVLSNHDLGRLVSRFGDEALRVESAKALATLVLLQRATPFIYQGDELGLVNCPFQTISDLNDVWAQTTYRLKLAQSADPDAAFQAALRITRDHARTPFPWTSDAGAGFTQAARPWLMLHPNASTVNAAAQASDPHSPQTFIKQLIALRRGDDLWRTGEFLDLMPSDDSVFLFERRLGARRGRVAINLRSAPAVLPDCAGLGACLHSYASPPAHMLRPWECVVWT